MDDYRALALCVIIVLRGVLIVTHIDPSSEEWLPVSITPPDGDLEVCVIAL